VSVSADPADGTTTYKKAGKVVSTIKTKVSDDGKLLTITTNATDAQGRPVHNVALYEKQQPR
jgi:hypothetical protein